MLFLLATVFLIKSFKISPLIGVRLARYSEWYSDWYSESCKGKMGVGSSLFFAGFHALGQLDWDSSENGK